MTELWVVSFPGDWEEGYYCKVWLDGDFMFLGQNGKLSSLLWILLTIGIKPTPSLMHLILFDMSLEGLRNLDTHSTSLIRRTSQINNWNIQTIGYRIFTCIILTTHTFLNISSVLCHCTFLSTLVVPTLPSFLSLLLFVSQYPFTSPSYNCPINVQRRQCIPKPNNDEWHSMNSTDNSIPFVNYIFKIT